MTPASAASATSCNEEPVRMIGLHDCARPAATTGVVPVARLTTSSATHIDVDRLTWCQRKGLLLGVATISAI